jgi:hypothetical protein
VGVFVRFSSPTAIFTVGDEGSHIRIKNAAVSGNNNLYTIETWINSTTVDKVPTGASQPRPARPTAYAQHRDQHSTTTPRPHGPAEPGPSLTAVHASSTDRAHRPAEPSWTDRRAQLDRARTETCHAQLNRPPSPARPSQHRDLPSPLGRPPSRPQCATSSTEPASTRTSTESTHDQLDRPPSHSTTTPGTQRGSQRPSRPRRPGRAPHAHTHDRPERRSAVRPRRSGRARPRTTIEVFAAQPNGWTRSWTTAGQPADTKKTA